MLVMPQKALLTPGGVRKVGEVFRFDDGKAHAQEIFSKLGNLEDIEIWYGQVLLALFIRDKMGSLIAAPDTQKEDRWQGKVGLVLKTGPAAFRSTEGRDFSGARADVGDWVLFRPSDGNNIDLRCLDGVNVIHCKVLEDAECRGRVRFPDRAW